MLTEREQAIVNKSKEWGFDAYLQWAWCEYPSLQGEITESKYPTQTRLRSVNKRMDSERKGFDVCYLLALPEEEVNPLQIEQDAWRLLSPNVRGYVNEFGIYIDGYSPKTAQQELLLAHVNTGWNLLQQWNVISQSYKAKYEQVWDKVTEREDAVRKLIQGLQKHVKYPFCCTLCLNDLGQVLASEISRRHL